MPIPAFDYVARPFYSPRHTSDTSRLQQIYARGGAELSQIALQRGATQADTFNRLAAIISGGIGTVREGRNRKEALALRAAEQEAARAEREAERAADKAEREAARLANSEERTATAMARQTEQEHGAARYAVEHARPGVVSPALMKMAQQFPDLADRFQILDGAPVLTATPEQADRTASARRQESVDAATAADRAADNSRADKQLAATIANRADSTEKPSVWISKGSDMQFVTPSEAAILSRQGWRSGNTREQGRPVIAGDAEDIAGMDEALKLAGQLHFKATDTGIMPSIGGAMPDAVTNLTGFGVEAKQRQGVINLVKQIIGKGLEGGVLRKEDESKYEKILPTLSDHPDVVTAKIGNLTKTMNQKRGVRLDALEDAGYDVTRFRARPSGANVTALPDLGGLQPGHGRTFSEGPFAGQTWTVDAQGTPRKVGG